MENLKEAKYKFYRMKLYCTNNLNIDPRTIDIVINYGKNFIKMYSKYTVKEIDDVSYNLIYLKFLKSKYKNTKYMN